jgi:hypothetical protein
MPNDLSIHGKKTKPYELWRLDIEDSKRERVAFADTIEEFWSKANLAFVINDCVVDKPLDMAKTARNNDQRLLDVLTSRHKPDKFVHAYLINPIENLNAGGGSYLDGDVEPASEARICMIWDEADKAAIEAWSAP